MFDEMVTEFNESVGAEKGIVVQAYSQGSVNDLTAKVMDAIDKKVGAEEVPTSLPPTPTPPTRSTAGGWPPT